jgi:hypothetical protein
VFISSHQNEEQNHNVRVATESFDIVANVKYLETTLANQHYIQEGTKSRLNSGNVCCHSLQNITPLSYLYENRKLSYISASFLWVCETWSSP